MQSFMDSPYYRALLEQSQRQGPASQYPGQAVANALSQGLDAFALKRETQKGESREKAYIDALGTAASPVETPNITGPITGPGQAEARQASGAYDQTQMRPQNSSETMAALLAGSQTGNQGATDALKDYAPLMMQQKMQTEAQANQPITPYQNASLQQQYADNDRAMKQFGAQQQFTAGENEKNRKAQAENAAASREATQAFRGASLAQGAERIAIQQQNAANRNQLSPRQQLMSSIQLRKEFDQSPDTKAFNEIASSYDVIDKLSKSQPSPQNDIAMVFSFMKVLDPNSVVREREYATAQNAAGVPEQVRNTYNAAINGQFLSPHQRAEFTRTAGEIYGARKSRYDQMVKQYQGYAAEGGLPDTTIQSRIPAGPQQAQPQATPTQGGADPLSQARDAIAKGAPRDAVIQRLRQNGIDPGGL